MSYSPTNWVEATTKLGPTNMNHLEAGVQATAVVADAAIPKPSTPATNAGLVYNGSTWVAALLVNGNIDPSANIAYSKLSLAGGVVNNDISTGAAIAYSKLSLTGGIVNADVSASAALAISKLASYPTDATKFLRGDGTWTTPGTRGSATIVWPGSASLSTTTTVTHSLGTTPTSVVATMGTIIGGVAVICPLQVTALGATTFGLTAQTIDGSTPAAASSIGVFWHAIA